MALQNTPQKKFIKDQLYFIRTAETYGVDPEDVVLLKETGCMICGSHDNLVMDHDHTTGTFRGILCKTCNSGLGFFKDSDVLIANALEYLNDSYREYQKALVR